MAFEYATIHKVFIQRHDLLCKLRNLSPTLQLNTSSNPQCDQLHENFSSRKFCFSRYQLVLYSMNVKLKLIIQTRDTKLLSLFLCCLFALYLLELQSFIPPHQQVTGTPAITTRFFSFVFSFFHFKNSA